MKALQITGAGAYDIVDLPLPELKDDQVLVRITLVSTCPRWDMSMLGGYDMFAADRAPNYPLEPGFPGHEAVGVVEAVGASVRGFDPGDRVAALEHLSPGQGAYAQYMAYREGDLLKLPDHISDKKAVSAELLKCVLYGLDQFGELRGKRMLIAGLGPAGLLAMQLAALWGAKATAVDVNAARVEAARSLGAGEALLADELGDRTFELGYDCVGAAASVQNVLDRTDEHIVVFGVLKGSLTYADRLWFKGVKLESYRYRRADDRIRRLLLDALGRPSFNTEILQTKQLSFRNYAEAVALLKAQQAVKICFDPQEAF
ncbi:Threonine dehydrogenase [Paenibacillus sp. UNC496MF]|uniref:zinc-dependent alcohol dehydrogenase n=1 Tax=Paenibacillus sp. UNC496MF TaxID=1502753 RepID=UPI0008E07D1B|nr:zinc-binding dehydrogenase [Paenibacillus sp. UNC496MF]SFI87569.1 Threonine dehydrogenase [Paenibacillus sp. UNC496MF]